jgi:hypothetical protein
MECAPAKGIRLTHTYTLAGKYNVKLKVDGLDGASADKTLRSQWLVKLPSDHRLGIRKAQARGLGHQPVLSNSNSSYPF